LTHVYEPWFVWGQKDSIKLSVLTEKGEIQHIASWELNDRRVPYYTDRDDISTILFSILCDFDIELVHGRQFVNLGLSILRIARSLGIPVVLSFHDYYLVCPTVFLTDGTGRFCGGDCSVGSGICQSNLIDDHELVLRNGWTKVWQESVRSMLECVDLFITTTLVAHDLIIKIYPELRSRRFEIVEHGRTFHRRYCIETIPSRNRLVRVLALGNYSINKGLDTVLDLGRLDGGKILEIHWLGTVPGVGVKPEIGVFHGPYEPDEVVERIKEIEPDFVLLLSTWAETYCHTLSEAWAAGIPVVGTRLGAIGARIAESGGGWVIDPHDAQGVLTLIAYLIEHPDEYRAVAARIPLIEIRETEKMANDYERLYADILSGRRMQHQH